MLALNVYWIHPRLIAPGMLWLDLEAVLSKYPIDKKIKLEIR